MYLGSRPFHLALHIENYKPGFQTRLPRLMEHEPEAFFASMSHYA